MKTLSPVSGTRDKCVKMPPTRGYTSKRRGNNQDNKRSKPRKLLRVFVEELLNEGQCRGLQWVDKPSHVFSVAWRHGSSSGFNPAEHSEVFDRWAVHTGKLKDGGVPDHSNNKSTFRCALHSLKDCIEHTKEGDKRGACAKRTFQFIDPGHPEYDSKKKDRSAKKSKIELKEETLDCASGTDEQDTWTLGSEHAVTDQDTSTWESPQNIEILDVESGTSTWSDHQEGTDRPASSTYLFLPLAVEEILVDTTYVAGDGLVAQNTVRETTPPAEVPVVMDSMPLGLRGAIGRSLSAPSVDDLLLRFPRSDAQVPDRPHTNGALVQGPQTTDDDDESTQPDTPTRSMLPVFSALGVSDEYEAPFCHTGLNSGGNVKVNKKRQLSLSSREIVIKNSVFNPTAAATRSVQDHASSAETSYDGLGIDSIDVNEEMDSNSAAEIESLDNMSLDEYLSDLQLSPLAEETHIVNFANFVFAETPENDASEIFGPDKY